MKNMKMFVKKHLAAVLVLAIALTASAGVLWAKYAKDVKVTDSLGLTVEVTKDYTIDKEKMWAVLDNLLNKIADENADAQCALKFVKGSEVPSGLSAESDTVAYTYTEDNGNTPDEDDNGDEVHTVNVSPSTTGVSGIQADGSREIGVYYDSASATIYIAPADSSDSKSCIYAPENCNRFLMGSASTPERSTKYADRLTKGTLLTAIDLDNLDTSRVTNMANMFGYLCNVQQFSFGSGFVTSSVTDMSYMFDANKALPTLDLSSFDTSKVTTMEKAFYKCSKLEKVTLGANFDFVGTDGYLPTPDSQYITGVNGRWSDSTTNASYTPEALATYHNDLNKERTYIAAMDYTIDPTMMQMALRSNAASCTALKFVKGSEAANLTAVTQNLQADGSKQINLYVDGSTAYIAPADTSDSTSVMYAPANSAYFLNGGSGYTKLGGKLTLIDCSNLDTSKVTNMEGMFSGCTALNALNLGANFDTSKVTSMKQMFYNCSGLTWMDLSGLDVSSVTKMDQMFSGCTGLTSLTLSGWDTSNVTTMSQMFNNCSGLTSLNVSGFDTSKVTTMASMFNGCESLSTLDLSSFDTSKVTTMTKMFEGCSKLEKVTLGANFDFAGTDGYLPAPDSQYITGASGVWYDITDSSSYAPEALATYHNALDKTRTYAAKLTYTIDKGKMWTALKIAAAADETPLELKFVTHSAVPAGAVLQETEIQTTGSGKIGVYVSENTVYIAPATADSSTSVMYAPADCSSFLAATNTGLEALQTIVFDNLDTSNVTSMASMFNRCATLDSIEIDSLSTDAVMNMSNMFYGCEALSALDLSGFNTSKVTNMSGMFGMCETLSELDLSSFNTAVLKNISYMFYGCQALTTITVSDGFVTGNITGNANKQNVFMNCTNLVGGNDTEYDENCVSAEYARIDTEETPGYFTASSGNGIGRMSLSLNTSGLENITVAQKED